MTPDETSPYDSKSAPEPNEPAGDDSADQEYKTSLLPKDFFKGKDLKVGDKETVEVVHIYSDEIEVKCVGKEESDPEPKESMSSKIDSMAMMNQ